MRRVDWSESHMCEQFWTRFPAYFPHFAPPSNVQQPFRCSQVSSEEKYSGYCENFETGAGLGWVGGWVGAAPTGCVGGFGAGWELCRTGCGGGGGELLLQEMWLLANFDQISYLFSVDQRGGENHQI